MLNLEYSRRPLILWIHRSLRKEICDACSLQRLVSTVSSTGSVDIPVGLASESDLHIDLANVAETRT